MKEFEIIATSIREKEPFSFVIPMMQLEVALEKVYIKVLGNY